MQAINFTIKLFITLCNKKRVLHSRKQNTHYLNETKYTNRVTKIKKIHNVKLHLNSLKQVYRAEIKQLGISLLSQTTCPPSVFTCFPKSSVCDPSGIILVPHHCSSLKSLQVTKRPVSKPPTLPLVRFLQEMTDTMQETINKLNSDLNFQECQLQSLFTTLYSLVGRQYPGQVLTSLLRKPVLGTSANRSASPQIRKLRTQGFGLRICGPISYRGFAVKKLKSTANPQINNITEIVSAISKKYVFTRGGVEDTRLEAKAKDTKKIQGQGQPYKGQTLLRPRTGMLEAKDASASALKKKKNRTSEKLFRRSSEKTAFQKIFQALHKLLTTKK